MSSSRHRMIIFNWFIHPSIFCHLSRSSCINLINYNIRNSCYKLWEMLKKYDIIHYSGPYRPYWVSMIFCMVWSWNWFKMQKPCSESISKLSHSSTLCCYMMHAYFCFLRNCASTQNFLKPFVLLLFYSPIGWFLSHHLTKDSNHKKPPELRGSLTWVQMETELCCCCRRPSASDSGLQHSEVRPWWNKQCCDSSVTPKCWPRSVQASPRGHPEGAVVPCLCKLPSQHLYQSISTSCSPWCPSHDKKQITTLIYKLQKYWRL